MLSRSLRTNQVFVPGGLPEYTYVARSERQLEESLRSASDHLCKLVTVTGNTKSGKTVLTQQVYPREAAVWLDGGAFDTEEDLWAEVVEQLDAFPEREVSSGSEAETGGKTYAEGGFNLGLAKGTGGGEGSHSRSKSKATTKSRRAPTKTTAIRALSEAGLPLIIDDFHYLNRRVQGSVVRALKAPIAQGHPVILLAIPHRRFDAVRVEKEMTGRVEAVPVPTWEQSELNQIATKGFPLLNVEASDDLIALFTAEALGSPHLMQEFCRQICLANNIVETAKGTVKVGGIDRAEDIFRSVAASTSKVVFDRLAQGPRQRSDRKERKLKGGKTGDIYFAVLMAIANLNPGVQTLEYEDIRASLRDLMAETPPQAHEVSRVLEKMAEISAEDEASATVIDWEKDDRRLHITDPFFAFFLKWGVSGLKAM